MVREIQQEPKSVATTHIKNTRLTTLDITGVGDRYIIDAGGSIVGPDPCIDNPSGAHDNRIDILGKLRSTFDLIISLGENTTITVAASGRLTGTDDGILAYGSASTVTNFGRIDIDGTAIHTETDIAIDNFGTVNGEEGVSLDFGTLVNHAGGRISGSIYAIHSMTGTDTRMVKITNDGLIESDATAILGRYGKEIVVNRGTIHGTIDLAGGDDSFDNRKGRIDGDVIGGGQDDTLITASAVTRLIEGAVGGMDTVRSTVSYTLNDNVETLRLIGGADIDATGNNGLNIIVGNSGDNRLSGLGGNDSLDGGRGDDRLTGGLFAQDTFVFATGYGTDTITDFEDGTDNIDLEGFKAVTGFDDLFDNHASETPIGDLVISAGNDRLIIKNMTLAQLDESDVFTL
jgi:Ca2+-binding RTX toxin-like protein